MGHTKALEDFADVLVAQATGAAAVREAWMDKLGANGVQMAVTGADKLPSPVVEAVECI